MSNRSQGRVLSAILPSCSDSLHLYPACQWVPGLQQKERSPIPIKYFSAHWQVGWTAGHMALPNLEILFLSLNPARLGQKSNALLQTPSQKHLQHHLKIRGDEEEQAVFPILFARFESWKDQLWNPLACPGVTPCLAAMEVMVESCSKGRRPAPRLA